MARIRTVKPEYFTHPEIVTLSIPARLLLLSLLTQADDEGRLFDQPMKIRANAFGENDRVKIGGLLKELADEGRILRYRTESKACIQVLNFNRHQTISKFRPSSLPPPPGLRSESGNAPDPLPPGSMQEGKGRGREPGREGNPEGNVRTSPRSARKSSSQGGPGGSDDSSEPVQNAVDNGAAPASEDLAARIEAASEDVLTPQLASVLTDDQAHLFRTLERDHPGFSTPFMPVDVEAVRSEYGDEALTESLRRIVAASNAEIRSPRGLVFSTVREVAGDRTPTAKRGARA